MKINKIILGIFSALCLSTNFLISAAVIENNTYEIKYENINNIETNNLISKFDSTQNTKLTKAKAKEGFIFLGWKTNNGTTIDIIPSGFNKNIVLSPILINEYNSYSTIKKLFLNSSEEIYYDTKIKQINQLINNEENTFGHEKYQLQKLIVEAINNFDNEVIQDDMPNSEFRIGSHASSESKVSVNRIEKAKYVITKTFNKEVSVWSLLWKKVKGWWNDWMSTAFYGLVGAGATIGIGYSVYTAYWNNKTNFKLEKEENLKITLELYPEKDININNWYAHFYNGGKSVVNDCSLKRKFKNNSSNGSNRKFVSISYILRNGPTNPKLLLYNLDNNDLDTNVFPIKYYYPGENKISFYKHDDKNKKLGELFIKREIITDDDLLKMYTKTVNCTECKCNSSCWTAIDEKKSCIAIEEIDKNNNNHKKTE
ncbi:hypothetical protein [Mycoplasma phocimorsus]|uniref:hypothetical protein n=1 Tax=Mycoplasma phocimorsus TaxID=3045839 RepID=UPI0024C0B81D|nr:hypothetical protein [Mycoplasma phocimorsus]MDJ1648052.1 hypothetical protein [Mycoplasma phocimorsus]